MEFIYFIAAAIIAILLPLLTFFMGQRLANHPDENIRQQNWALFWLATASLLMLAYAVFARTMLTTLVGLVLILAAPTLWCALGLLILNARAVLALMNTRRTLVTLLLLWLLAALVIIALENGYIALFVILPSLLVALLWGAGRSLGMTALLVVSLLLAAFLLLDATGVLARRDVFLQPTLRAAYSISSTIATLLALGFAAVWVFRAYRPTAGKQPRRALYLSMALLLVVSACAVTLRAGLLTKATGRAAEDHFPLGAFAAALASGLVLAFSLKDAARRVAIAYLVIVPLLIVVAFSVGYNMNPVSITEARAARINQAIQAYKGETGAYPPELGSLVPGYAKIMLGPLTGSGQIWCYQAGDGYYRLGYVWHQRYYHYPDNITPFTEPYYTIIAPYAAGSPPSGEWMCDQELRRFKETGG